MRGKKFVAWALSAIMAVAPLSACAQQPAGGGAAEGQADEEMNRDVGPEVGETISVDANDEGVYTVTIAEKNLTEDQSLAEEAVEVVTAEEAGVGAEAEMSRGAVEAVGEGDAAQDAGADAAGEGDTAQDAGVTGDETGKFAPENGAVEPAADKDADATQEAEASQDAGAPKDGAAKEPAVEPGAWSLASVRREDVVVAYNVPAGDGEVEEPQYETRQAEVTDFNNDDGTIALTFKGEAGAADTYTVRFAGTESYAVVHVAPADNGVVVEGVDYDALVAELSEYEPSFTEEDISLPEGTHLEDGELVVEEDAPEAVQEALVESGFAEGEMSRADADDKSADSKDGDEEGKNATIEYMQKCKETEWDYENYDAVAQYVPEVLSEIDPKASQVAELGANAYRIARGFYRNEWTYIAEGGLGVLKMFGLFKGAGGGVSNEQILSEVQKVGVEVTELHCLTRAMKAELNETLRATYENSIQIFDSALNSMHANAEVVQNMLTQGAIRAAEDGIEPPAEDCSPEEEYRYNYDLVEYIEKLEAAGGYDNSAFKGFTKHMENLTSDFTKVTGEVGDPNRSGPVATYDKYWNLYFNYDTEGYYLRKSYRANIEYELKRAFGLLEIYYNVFAPATKGNYRSYNNDLWKALERLENQDAGTSPEEALSPWPYESRRYLLSGPVRCNTFDKTIESVKITYCASGNNVGTDALDEYVQRLHGRSVEDDLKLAGLWSDSWAWKKGEGSYDYSPHGLGFNGTGSTKDSTYKADIIAYGSGQIHKQQTTFANYKDFSVFDDDAKQWMMNYIWFYFKE